MGNNELIQKFIDFRPLPELKEALDRLREKKRMEWPWGDWVGNSPEEVFPRRRLS